MKLILSLINAKALGDINEEHPRRLFYLSVVSLWWEAFLFVAFSKEERMLSADLSVDEVL